MVIALAFFALTQPLVAAGSSAPSLTTNEIVARMSAMDAERAAKKQGYRGTRLYTLDYKGFPSSKHAEMTVQVVNTLQQKQFAILSESGSRFLLNRVLHKIIESEREASGGANRREVKLTPENYRFQLVGTDTVQGRPCYVLQVTPLHSNKFLYMGKVWIDAEDFALTQIAARPAKNPSFWISSVQIEHQYEKHGIQWLPRRNRSTSSVRLGGSALLTIDYQNYEFADHNAANSLSRQNP